MENKYKFFWSSKSPFSNWYKTNFIHKGIKFTSSEQAMMYFKAKLFNDNKITKEILSTNNPKDQKYLGRKIENFDDKIWNENKYKIVKEILMDKFSQQEELKEELIYNRGKIFVEASPYDRIWGIGYSESDALENINNWGENLLGKILTEISKEIKY